MPTAAAADVAMIGRVREADAEARSAQTTVFLLAAEWADAHLDPDAPATSGDCLYGCRAADRHDVEVGDFAGGCAERCAGDPDGFHDPLIPVVRWDAAAPFGAAIGRTSQAGSLMIRDSLLTRHRLPRVWRRVAAGEVEPHKARMLAQSVIGRPCDVSDHLDVRRSRAVGVLADPAAALALLSGQHAPAPSKRAQLVLTLTSDGLTGDPVAHNTTTGRAVLEQAVREWCGRTDTHLQVLPVLDLAGHDATDAYRPEDATVRRSDLVAQGCVFPHCTRSAVTFDHDHVVPYDHDDPTRGGPSCDCNIAPLCRHHHQLKTHAGWGYSVLDTGLWLWSDPHGQQFLRDRIGTTGVTPSRRCRQQE